MTSPRGSYDGGYYGSSRPFADTPIYDSLVAERGTPQIAPIRVPLAYDAPASNLPALPALPSASSPPQAPQSGYLGSPQPPAYFQQPAPAPHVPQPAAPTPYVPQQAANRPYNNGGYQSAQYPYQYGGAGYATEPPRPVPPRPMPPRPAPAAPYP